MKFTLFLSLLLVVLTIRRNYRTKQVEPTPPQTVQTPINDSTAEKVGETIANRYWEIFKTIDVNNDNEIDSAEVAKLYNEYGWPKPEKAMDDKDKLTFVDFCQLMESLWKNQNVENKERCKTGYTKAIKIIENTFTYLDRDKDGFITKDDILQGISLLLQKDVDEKEVNKLITAHGEKLPKDVFVLAVANGELDKSLSRALESPNINNEKLNTFI